MGSIGEEHVALKRRVAELERERDALQRHYDAAGPEHNLLALLDLYFERETTAENARDEALSRAERAEANNAALLEALRTAVRALCKAQVALDWGSPERLACGRAGEDVETVLDADHPGAALLEELRALRKVLDVVLDLGPMDVGNIRLYDGERFERLRDAVADALKEKT